jgi:hypothetical protein
MRTYYHTFRFLSTRNSGFFHSILDRKKSAAPDRAMLQAGERCKSLLVIDLPAGRQVTDPARAGAMAYRGWRKAKNMLLLKRMRPRTGHFSEPVAVKNRPTTPDIRNPTNIREPEFWRIRKGDLPVAPTSINGTRRGYWDRLLWVCMGSERL